MAIIEGELVHCCRGFWHPKGQHAAGLVKLFKWGYWPAT